MSKKKLIQLEKTNAKLAKELLQKERELKIEASLEKVRVIAMAMKQRDDMLRICKAISNQLKLFGVKEIRNVQTAIFYEEKGTYMNYEYYIKHKKTFITETIYNSDQIHKDFAGKMLKGKGEVFIRHIKGKKVKEFLNDQKKTNVFIDEFLETASSLNYYWYSLGPVALGISTYHPLTKDEQRLFHRFVNVFELAYRRYSDIENAEAQAREAQIEAALERVRSRSIGMRKSEELKEVIKIVYDQFIYLNIHIDHAGFVVDYTSMGDWHFWIADKQDIPAKISTPWFDSVWANDFNEAKEKGLDFFPTHLNFEEKNKFYHKLLSFVPDLPEESRNFYLNCPGLAASTALSETVSLYIENFSGIPYSDEENKILIRFGKVFQQTYTRFLDLENAEAQAREAQIEAALERVRSRSMGMQKTDELKEIIQVIYTQLVYLNMRVDQAGFVMDYKETDGWNIWIADQIGVPSKSYIPYFDSPQWIRFIEAKQKGQDSFTSSLTFDEKNQFFQMIFKYVSGVPEEVKGFVYSTPGFATSNALLKYVCLFINNFSGIPYSDEDNAIVMRFARVFEQTYIRFNDLKQAEAQALEATKRASVDRIRAEIASMRTTKDLERITPLIWNELTTIGVPFIRCGVFIMDEEQQQINIFLSTPEGKGIAAAFHLPYTANRETMQIVSFWNKKEMYRPHWDEAAFIDFTKVLGERGAITSGEKFLVESRPSDLYLHFLPFQQGMLYVGDTDSLNNEHLQLVQALAEAFSTAYLRYEDFNKLESAKAQIEKTLVDLKQAQSQLVQAEKMASLGELTAGIAHEIQNPLNFVNNFSEVNNELIEELTAERVKPKTERDEMLENELLDNIKQNLEKINNHGKRADSIVKGMLQHSRSSSGQKELTDINALADEYLRLAYHGYRAKEKFFNAKFETDFDKSIEKINIVSQDIGRVILNLINNAFYAVNEKRKTKDAGYEPAIKMATSQSDNQLSITVSDNGNGIPKNIVDKIFQPFFTTKPTGSGTGLGLSLAYDIIKAHGGDLKVSTKEGEGSEFIIYLPA